MQKTQAQAPGDPGRVEDLDETAPQGPPPIIVDGEEAYQVNTILDTPDAGKFEDFVRYLGDKSGRQRLDRQFGDHIIHWLTYAELCAPCDISYNVVGHHETLERDAPYILKAAGIADLVSYPNIPLG
ncbi:hypothetical protein QQF64_001127 [Cirrhinus molitorella]|uniref:Carbohydrate sulfotransferase n=1 Tax=Cirrhinus molitorella TaxID=172907 RepID=A0ABR3NZH9_9TELE